MNVNEQAALSGLIFGIHLFHHSSIKRRMALVWAGIALAAGRSEQLTASVTAEGVQYGGIVGTAVPLLLGLWETFRREV